MISSPEDHTDYFLRNIRKTITEHRMFKENDAVLVGLSGGPDSVALLKCLQLLAPAWGLRIGAAHLNHALRAEQADGDAAFAAKFAASLNVECHVQAADVAGFRRTHRLSLEEAARIVRYDYLSEVAVRHGYSKIALGHHADDNAELVVMNILRGSGMKGLAGIPAVRPLGEPAGKIVLVRPLMRVTKQDILSFLNDNQLAFRSDATNQDPQHLRNRIRHDLLPALKKNYNPNIVNTLNRLATVAHSEEAWITEQIPPLYKKVRLPKNTQRIGLSITRLMAHPLPVARRIVRSAIAEAKGNLRKITFRHVELVLDLCRGRRPDGRLDLPDRVRIERNADELGILKGNKPLRTLASLTRCPPVTPYAFSLEKPGTVRLDAMGMVLSAQALPVESVSNYRKAGHHAAFFDIDTLYFPLIIRNLQSGDTFRPLGAAGRQKVKKFFADHKVPLRDRNKCPILVSAGKPIWVVGHRIDEEVKVTETTKIVLKVTLDLAEPVDDD